MKNLATKSETPVEPGLDKRRTTRVVHAFPIKVEGVDALGEAFTENTNTVMVNCHGCKYQSKHYAPKGSIVTVEIPRHDPAAAPRVVAGKVIWVQRPAQAREILHIGVQFETAGSVWDLPSPPNDWFALPGEELFSMPATADVPEFPIADSRTSEDGVEIVTFDEHEIGASAGFDEASPKGSPQAMLGAAPMATEAKAEASSVIRAKVDAQLHDVIEEAIATAIDRLSESAVQKVVQQAVERSAQVAEEAQGTIEAAIEKLDAALDAKLNAKLDEKVKKAVEDAVSKVTENRHGKTKHRR